ncbi:TlyA family RNA methyltransferase [Dictyobacter kobayashii]|uniref:TlyA family rRNA (Cytidine-2'-O)-methyltransferase n=1 Tax=Dictyobacter kobayashii TaxID=2014872 RepID=A0A402AUD9_9CHLR|nr:TlyA family RNA methyltransferase [Dictyobacter kobayashii]GCE22740.1 TlyA family rRNA (cytidine-2'-O)-methyltransferase [Dictyobacter kobayashii]
MSSSPFDYERAALPPQVPCPPLPRRLPLARLLVARGFFEHLDEATRWVMAGKVLVDERCLDKPGMLVASQAVLRVRDRLRYASRGGYKLETALHYFDVDVQRVVALDCGASTGGFTDCLLQRGAAQVYAVEVGHGQLLGRLRLDARVLNYEHTNFGDLVGMDLSPVPSLITLDLSYLSLTKALPIAASLLPMQGRVLALFKPLFEVECSEARRKGYVEEPALLADALQRVLEAGISCGLLVDGVVKLALQPRNGVHEFFLSFRHDLDGQSKCYSQQALLAMVTGVGVGPTSVADYSMS